MSSERPDWLITESRVHELHATALAQHGGLPGVKDAEGVERCIGAALLASSYLDEDDAGPGAFVVAVRLGFYLARGHCFTDGNKRVGMDGHDRSIASRRA